MEGTEETNNAYCLQGEQNDILESCKGVTFLLDFKLFECISKTFKI